MSDRARRIASLSPAQRRRLERMLRERATKPVDRGIPALPRRSPTGQPAAFPLSPAQESVWVGEQEHVGLFPATPTLRLRGPLDVEALQAGLTEICARHEALRTTFHARNGQPVQVVHAPQPVPLNQLDLRQLPPPSREARAAGLLAEEAQRPFDLARDSMLRATLLRLDEEEHLLLVVIHHIACDAWSLDVLFGELEALYGPLRAGRQPRLPEVPVQYVDYAVWQRRRLAEGALRASTDYWKRQLAGDPEALDLPTDHPPRALRRWQGAWQEMPLPASLSGQLEAISRRYHVTMFMTVLAGWVTLLHAYSGQEDILILTAFANRTLVEVEGVIGLFAQGVILRHDLSGDPFFTELLGRVRATAIDALPHSELPYQDMLAELRHELRAGFFMPPSTTPKLEGLQVERIQVDHSASAFLSVGLFIVSGDSGLTARLTYDPDLFEATTAAGMLGHVQAVLERAVAEPAQRISALATRELTLEP